VVEATWLFDDLGFVAELGSGAVALGQGAGFCAPGNSFQSVRCPSPDPREEGLHVQPASIHSLAQGTQQHSEQDLFVTKPTTCALSKVTSGHHSKSQNPSVMKGRSIKCSCRAICMKALAHAGLRKSILFLCTLPQLLGRMEVNLKHLRSPLLGKRFQRLSPAVVLSIRWFRLCGPP
jgi:hypothetical protein